jgi:hypothetical protein
VRTFRAPGLQGVCASLVVGGPTSGWGGKILREMSISILNDIMNLPQQVVDPHWLETLEKEGDS